MQEPEQSLVRERRIQLPRSRPTDPEEKPRRSPLEPQPVVNNRSSPSVGPDAADGMLSKGPVLPDAEAQSSPPASWTPTFSRAHYRATTEV